MVRIPAEMRRLRSTAAFFRSTPSWCSQKPRGVAKASNGIWLARTPSSAARRCATRVPRQGDVRGWETDFTLSPDAGKRFGRYTEANINNKLAVVLDNQAVSVATIEAKIEDSGRITGLGSQEEAIDLRAICARVRCPPAFKYLEDRTIGPSLGADSIHEGFVAGTAGLIAVVLDHAGLL